MVALGDGDGDIDTLDDGDVRRVALGVVDGE
jgi:hypothetical protein